MPQLLLELLSEEIPARFQAQARRDLERLADEGLRSAELTFASLSAFAGLRRLTLLVEGLADRQADRLEERKGPRLGATPAAIAGFLRSAGAAPGDLIERDGAYFVAFAKPGRPAEDVLPAFVDGLVRGFPWPKSMTWGAGALRWVRPLQHILCVFDREIVALQIEDLAADDLTWGHRFMGASGPFRARDMDEYREGLGGHFVVLSGEERRRRIREGAQALCRERGLELVEDESLVEENAGLAEWPIAVLGHMDPGFLTLPPEVIRTSMRAHQRYFAVGDGRGSLAPHFVAVANIEPADGGALFALGAARVLAARLADARFFYEEDRRSTLKHRLERLQTITFHAELGSMRERAARLEALAGEIAGQIGADSGEARRAGLLAKADLTTAMVGEFPELQGVMGGYYAQPDEGPVIAAAIRDHYRPQGPKDRLPDGPVSLAVALADKIDLLAGFFAIGQRPTGSRDPVGLRRAALGIVRIVLESGVRLRLGALVGMALDLHRLNGDGGEIVAFIVDRLKVSLRESGRRHDLVDAIFALGDDDLVRILARLEALRAFLESAEGPDLLAGYRRAANILAAEAKKGEIPRGEPNPAEGAPNAERALFAALLAARPKIEGALAEENFVHAMAALAGMRSALDRFFDQVLVNSPAPEEREGRLRLLRAVRDAMGEVADFSRISG